MFSVRLVTADSYQAAPLPQLDPTYSEFRGAEIKYVPIVRVFGTTATGEKTCLHLHGVFPYMYVPFTGEDNANANAYAYKLAASLDAAINISLGSATSNIHHVYQIQHVAGIPYYGYHKREHQFFKVHFYNPAMMKKATDLLQNGSVLNAKLQPHEAHIPYILQFMMDYNLHGMSFINLSNVKYRCVTQLLSGTKLSNDSITSPIDAVDYLPSSVVRQSMCQLEVDALVSDIQNRQELQRGIELNPGLAAIWEEERARRTQAGLSSVDSQLANSTDLERVIYHPTASDIYQQQRLNRRLQFISQSDESTLPTSTSPTSYSLEVNDDDDLIKASNLGTRNRKDLDKSQQNFSDDPNFSLFGASRSSDYFRPTHDGSVLGDADMPLVEMLMELAFDADNNNSSIDDDSVLGTQSSTFDNVEDKSDVEDDDDVSDLNITCSELDAMSPRDEIRKSLSQLIPVNTFLVDTAVPQTSRGNIFVQDNDSESHDSGESGWPQLDGAGDLSNFLESDEDESGKRFEELKCVSECQKPISDTKISHNDDEAVIVEELISGSSKYNRNRNFTMAFATDTWPSYMPNETNLEQFDTMNYETMGSVFESDFDHGIGMSLLLSGKDEASVGINLTIEDDGIPLEAVLTGDPCFTQTAEMDKSDFVELQDQYVSLLDSALVPDVHKNLYDSSVMKNYCDRLNEKEIISLNLRTLRFTTDNRNCNLSSENVTPNIQEHGAKVYKKKLNLPNAFARTNENRKDLCRLPIDSSDYNCNLVATWDELQDSKFIPKRMLKRKGFGKVHKQVSSRRATLSDSMMARRRGRRRRVSSNVKSNIVQDDVEHIVNSLSNILPDVVSSETGVKAMISSLQEKATAKNCTSTAVNAVEKTSRKYPEERPRNENSSYDAMSREYNDESTGLSFTDNGSTQNTLRKISVGDSVDSVRNTLPVQKYTGHHAGASENVVQPIVTEHEEPVNIPTENKILFDNDNLKNVSHYSSARSHSSVTPFGKHNHRHCYYSYIRMGLIEDYVFTPDEIWVIERWKRGKQRSLSPTVCNRNCRLPFVRLQKVEMVNTADLDMTQLSIRKMGPENLNLTYNSNEINIVRNNDCVNNASISHELFSSSKSLENTDAETSFHIARHEEQIIVDSQTNCEIDMRKGDYVDCDEKLLPMNDSAFTQSAQISSTQNHHIFARRKDSGPVMISRIFQDKSYEGKVGRKKQSIILKLDESNNTSVSNPKSRSPKIVAFSISKNNDANTSANVLEHCIQPELMTEITNKSEFANATLITIMQSSETETLSKEGNSDSPSTSLSMQTIIPQSHHQVTNTISQDDTEITDISSITNRESNIISSSQSASAISGERPEIWCSVDREKVDLLFVAEIKNEKNIDKTSGSFDSAHKTSSACSEFISSQIFEDDDDNSISKNTIVTNLHGQRFNEYDDTSLNAHLCDSIYEDDVTLVDTFEASESIGEHTTSSDDCGNNNESEQYTIAVAEPDFYAEKNYRIEAISLEIPQCLFEEDSNSEISQKKSANLIFDNVLKAQSVENFLISKTTPNTCESVNNEAFNMLGMLESDSSSMPTIDNPSSSNVTRYGILKLNNVMKPSSMLRSKEMDEVINKNELSNHCNHSRSPILEKLDCAPSSHNDSNGNFDEEMFARMTNSILVLRGFDKTPVKDDSFHADNSSGSKTAIDYRASNNIVENTSDDSSSKKSENSLKNADEKTVGSVVKYSPNKISIIRQIYSSRTKISYKTSNNADRSTPNEATSSVGENGLSNTITNCWDGGKKIEDDTNDRELVHEIVSGVNESMVNIDIPVTNRDFSPTNNTGIQNNKNSTILSTQIYLHDDTDMVALSLDNCYEPIPLKALMYESNNNRFICQVEALTVEDDELLKQISRDQNFKRKAIVDQTKDLDLNFTNKKTPTERQDHMNESMLTAYDNDYDNIIHLVKSSTADQYQETDAIIEAVGSPWHSAVEDVTIYNNRMKNPPTNGSSELWETKDSGVQLSILELHNEIIAEPHGTHIGDNTDEDKVSESNNNSKSSVKSSDCDNHITSIAICRDISIALERLDVNNLNKYQRSYRNVETYDTDVSMKMTPEDAKCAGNKFTIQKKCVKFNEEVFVFDSDELIPLIDVEDKVVDEDNQMELPVDDDDVPEMIEIFDETESIAHDSPKIVSNVEAPIVSDNIIIDCVELIDDHIIDIDDDDDDDDDDDERDCAVQMGSTTIARGSERKIAEKNDTRVNYFEAINGEFEQTNEVPMKDSGCNFNSRKHDICLEDNKNIQINIEGATLKQKEENIKYRSKNYYSDVQLNQEKDEPIEKIDTGHKEIEIKSAITLEPCDKFFTECDANSVSRNPSPAADSIPVKNNTLVNNLDDSRDSIDHDNLSTMIKRKPGAIAYSNVTSVIATNERNKHRTESRYKRKRDNILTTQTQLSINTSINNVSTVANSYECFQDGDRILRLYRTSSEYRNKIHTVSIDQKMLFTKVTISDQQSWKKSPKERFLGHIGLCSLKPRGFGWLPEHTMTGSIQLKQPHVVLQRLAPSILKYYGYTRRFKSNKFGKRFKPRVNNVTIPAYDGPADLSSSDSELDSNSPKIDSEKRVCVYQSSKKKIEREAIATQKKRKQSHSDDDEETNKRKYTKRCTSPQNIGTSKTTYRSPHMSALKSVGVSGNYSPLKIIVTSQRVHKEVHNNLHEPCIGISNAAANIDSMNTTPRSRKLLMHKNLHRSRIGASPADGQGNVRKFENNVEQQLMGELNILDTYITVPKTQSLAVFLGDKCRSQDISSNLKDALNVRKNLFFSSDNSSPVGLFSSECDAGANERDDSIERTTLLTNSEIVRPCTSGYIDLHVKNINSHSENEDNNDTTVYEQSSEEFCLKYPPSIRIEELTTNSKDELCNDTFTQYLRSREQMRQPLSCCSRSQILSKSDQLIFILPKMNSPTIERVIDTMETYNIPKFRNIHPYFSNRSDVTGQKEILHKISNVSGNGVMNSSVFKSTLQSITGINRWCKMKINEFHLARGVFESKSRRLNLAGNASVVITPLLPPPTPNNVTKWLKVQNYLKITKKEAEGVAASQVGMKKSERNITDVENILQNEWSNTSGSSVEKSPKNIIVSSSAKLLPHTTNVCRKDETELQAVPSVEGIIDHSSTMPNSSEIGSSLESILAKSALFKEIVQSKQLGLSCGQIECLTETMRSNVDNENMQKCKTLKRYQFITILCVEVHVSTRYDLLPNPQYDPISALFYAIQSDVPPTAVIQPLKHGVITICAKGDGKSGYCCGSEVPFAVSVVADEAELFKTFIDIVNGSDAEILIGWEIESLSWGYIFQRALKLGIDLIKSISRVPASQCKRDNQMSDNVKSLADMKLPGRIVLDIWRIMRSEIALLTYSFENVIYHVMNERLPCFSFKSLTIWWTSAQSRWKVVQHYSTKILGILRILEQLDIIGRTSEYARLFGIQFHEVFTRGSQYRVESLMLRLAKPLNYVAVSLSPQQRSCMRAMEALPLIMEPESMFYSDPVVVLDFQSLYPSIIIAHNYCYSTCLGRVEHIGQLDPFKFGGSVLRVPKRTALKMEGKVNFAPCGVAFVKPHVRCGILPRMLTEILNTRLMVKKSMKDHSKDDKLLQRVLHARQKGLKDLANVTYGYTAANFTGRMPCVEVGDSVVSKAKETLERAIKLVESTTKWGARVIYGDTDSLFILVPDRSKDDAFRIGYEIADAVTASNLSPIKLKFEKILYPAILQSKKRYCGYMYETPAQTEPIYLAKGIETVRRDGCPAVSKILEKSLRILFDTKDVSSIKKYVTKQLDKVLSGKVSLEDLTFAKEFRGIKGYRERACVPALELTRRLMKKDPRALPRRNERVRYVIVAGAPNHALIHCVRSPWELIDNPGLRPNGTYYVTRVIIPPLNRCFNLIGVDVGMWYRDMPHRQMIHNPVPITKQKQKQTISQYFGTVFCTSCGQTTNRGICNDCLAHPTDSLIILHERLRWLERINDHVTMICQSCIGHGCIVDCVSLDCPVLYRRTHAQRDLTHATELRRIIQEEGKLDF